MDREDCRGIDLAREASLLGRLLPEVISLMAAHVHDLARLFLQETPPGKDGDEVAQYLTYTLLTFVPPAYGCGSGLLPWGTGAGPGSPATGCLDDTTS